MPFFNVNEIAAVPWKNGQGITREIVCEKDEHEKILYRISVADIQVDSAFSCYENIDRKLSILQGNGVKLFKDSGNLILTQNTGYFGFSGDEAIYSELILGPVRDFNVMVNPACFQSEVHFHQASGSMKSNIGLVLLKSGHCRINSVLCDEAAGYYWQGSEEEVVFLDLSPDAQLISVSITPV